MQLCSQNIIELLINHFSPRCSTVKHIFMRTDFNQILARDDYKRMTENLKSVTEEIAANIRKKMEQLDIASDNDFDNGEIGADNVIVRVISVSSNCGATRDFLAIKRDGNSYGFEDWRSLEDIDDTYYYTGDFNAQVRGASNKEALAFLNVAAKLITGLGEIEQKNIDAIQNALDNAPTK